MMGHQGQKEFRRGLRSLFWSGALALVSFGGWWLYSLAGSRSPDPVAVRLVTVERGTVETTINASGTVQLRGQQTLKSPAEGAVDQVLVQPGDRIQSGQVLLTLRNPDRQTALADQQIKINQQEITLLRSRQQIAESQQQLGVDQQRLQRLRTLAAAGAIAQNDVQDQEDKTRTTQTALRTAEAEARTAVLQLESLRLESRRIQQQLDNTVVASPIDGVVLGVNVQDGDGVELRTDLLTLGDPSEELVQLQLSTLDAARVEVNQPVRVSVIGPDPDIFTGQVQSLYPQAIAPSSEQGSSSSDQSGQATVPTTVRLAAPTETLIPGGQVNVEIILQQRQNVVALSIEAIQRSGSSPFVWVLDRNKTVQQQPITLGLEGLTTVEVTSGLRSGEEIVLPPPDVVLEPGMSVTAESQDPPPESQVP